MPSRPRERRCRVADFELKGIFLALQHHQVNTCCPASVVLQGRGHNRPVPAGRVASLTLNMFQASSATPLVPAQCDGNSS